MIEKDEDERRAMPLSFPLCSLVLFYELSPPGFVSRTWHMKSVGPLFLDMGTEGSVLTPPACAWQDNPRHWLGAVC